MGPLSISLSTKFQVNHLWILAFFKSDLMFIHNFLFSLFIFGGAGLVSRNKYHYGFFSASIKLPSGLTSGVVVAFYVSLFFFIVLCLAYLFGA